MPDLSDAYLRALPKTDLHVHLDGSLRLSTLRELAKEQNVTLPSDTDAGLCEQVFKPQYADLTEYLAGFQYTVSVLQTAEALERVAYELAEDNLKENVRYLEVRFAPQLHLHEHLNAQQVLQAVARGMQRARDAHNLSAAVTRGEDLPFEFGIIVCALRWFHSGMSGYYGKLFDVLSFEKPKNVFAAASEELARIAVHMRREHGLPIVGFDLAGAEAGNPALDHRASFMVAHRNFLPKTVHAGEAYGPESIFQALTECHADRIGHATYLFSPDQIVSPEVENPEQYVHNLVQSIAKRRICIEVNLTSNLQTLPHLTGVRDHPLRKMIDHSLSATLCTDNRLVSHTTVTKELQLAARELALTRSEVRNLIVAGFKGSFYPGDYREKRKFVRRVLDRIDAVDRGHCGRSEMSAEQPN